MPESSQVVATHGTRLATKGVMFELRAVWVGVVVVASLLAFACSDDGGSNGSSSQPPSLAARCEAICTADGEHPCAGEPFDSAACARTCVAKLQDKSEECSQCYVGLAGLRGSVCSCTTAGSGSISADIACEECTYIGSARSCQTQLINKCTAGARSCEGFHDVALDNQYCASRCGMPVNDTRVVCGQACVRPRDKDHPCSEGDVAAVEACTDACVAATEGKSQECRSCYLAKSYWLGSTCDCDDDGTDCRVCNLAGNRGGTSRACADVDYACGTLPQCEGWQSQESACAECGAEPLDAGADTDADTDAGDVTDAGDAADAANDAGDGASDASN